MGIRPDIAATLGIVNQFASNPNEAHWKAVKCILRYLKGAIDYSIVFNGIWKKMLISMNMLMQAGPEILLLGKVKVNTYVNCVESQLAGIAKTRCY